MNGKLTKIKVSKYKIEEHILVDAKSKKAQERFGYGLKYLNDFYHALKKYDVVIKDLSDFKLLILPVFYFIHGEEYDS